MTMRNGEPERNRRPEEIQEDIDRLRHEIEDTLNALQRDLSLNQLMDRVKQVMRSRSGEAVQSASCVIRDNPVTMAFIGAGVA